MDIESLPGGRAVLKRQESSTYGGLLGHELGRRASLEAKGDVLGAATLATVPNILARLVYDEDDFPAAAIDLHVFVFDKDGEYLDCVCYRNAEIPGISLREKVIRIDWQNVPSNCHLLVFCVAAYTLGMAIRDLEEAHVLFQTNDEDTAAKVIERCPVATELARGSAYFYAIIAEDSANDWQIVTISLSADGHTPDMLLASAKDAASTFLSRRARNAIGEVVAVKTGRNHQWGSKHSGGKAMLPPDAMNELNDKLNKSNLSHVDRADRDVKSAQQQPHSAYAGVVDTQLKAKLQQRRQIVADAAGEASSPEEDVFVGAGPSLIVDRVSRVPTTYSKTAVEPSAMQPMRQSSAVVTESQSKNIAKIMQSCSTLELSLASLEMQVQSNRQASQPLRSSLEKLEWDQSQFIKDLRERESKTDERMRNLEESMSVMNDKLDTIMECFRESGYIS